MCKEILLCTIMYGLPLCACECAEWMSTEMYFMAITENAIAIRALNFNLAEWCQMVQMLERKKNCTETIGYVEQTMDALLICSKSNSNYECPLH